MQRRSLPSTPRPFATKPARPHSSPAFAFDDGTFTAVAGAVPEKTSARDVARTPALVTNFFKDICLS